MPLSCLGCSRAGAKHSDPMFQLDRTHDHSPAFDLSLQAVLGLTWLLSQVEALRPESETIGSRAESCAPPRPSGDQDPASLAVLGVIAVACEFSPVLETLCAGSPRQLPMAPEGVASHVRGGARRNQVRLDGLLR